MIKRIDSIDVLRGFALLGILLMNISSFSMPSMAYFSPYVYDVTVLNHILYSIGHVIADQKFMAIFSMLFGASTMLFVQSAMSKKKRPMMLFYSRNFWLLIIGWIHARFVWYGDILFIYAFCSFLLFFFRNLRPRAQFIIGCIIYLIPSFSNFALNAFVFDHLDNEDHHTIMEHWNPPEEELQKELEAYNGSYYEQIKHREKMWSSDTGGSPSAGYNGKGIIGLSFLIDLLSRSFGMMLVGMAAFSWGIFSNSLQKSFYQRLTKYGFCIGFPLSAGGLALAYHYNWDWHYMQFIGRAPNHIATPFIAFGYIGLVMLCIKNAVALKLQDRLKSIGKTALTGYLVQSFLATYVFYGFGLSLFGQTNRIEQLAIVVLIWAILMLVFPIWLKKFYYGPIEWIWRMLTHLKFVKISR